MHAFPSSYPVPSPSTFPQDSRADSWPRPPRLDRPPPCAGSQICACLIREVESEGTQILQGR